MSIVLPLFCMALGLIGLGALAGWLMRDGRAKRELREQVELAEDRGYQRAKDRFSAVQNGSLQYRSLSRAKVKLHDPRETREIDGRALS